MERWNEGVYTVGIKKMNWDTATWPMTVFVLAFLQ